MLSSCIHAASVSSKVHCTYSYPLCPCFGCSPLQLVAFGSPPHHPQPSLMPGLGDHSGIVVGAKHDVTFILPLQRKMPSCTLLVSSPRCKPLGRVFSYFVNSVGAFKPL